MRALLHAALALAIACQFGLAHAKGGKSSGPHYGGGKHTSSHGGSYKGGKGASHKGGTYKNTKTGDQYGKHK